MAEKTIIDPLEVEKAKFQGEVLENISKPASEVVVDDKHKINGKVKDTGCLKSTTGYNGVFNLVDDIYKAIDDQKIHFNNMIRKLNEIKANRKDELTEAFKKKNPDKEVATDIDNCALQEGWIAKITDVHGDLFSMLASLVYVGAVDFVEGDFTYYDVKTGTYLTQEVYDQLEDKSLIYVIPTPHINPNFEGTIVILGDYIDRGPESLQCICMAELISFKLGKQMVNIIGNHEAMLGTETVKDKSYGYKLSQGLIKNIIQRGINGGYFNTCVVVDTGNKDNDGKPIYESYAHTMICQKHLMKMFKFVQALMGKLDSNEFLDNNNCGKNASEKFNAMKLVWAKQYQNLDDGLRGKIEQALSVVVVKEEQKAADIYNQLKEIGFEDVDYFRIKNAIGNAIFYYHNGGAVDYFGFFNKDFISAIGSSGRRSGMDWIFGERHMKLKEDDCLNVNQSVGHDCGDFVVTEGNVTYLDTFRSVGYRENESRATVYISNSATGKIILHEDVINRQDKLITDQSKLMKDTNEKSCIKTAKDDSSEVNRKFEEIETGGYRPVKKKDDESIKKYQGRGNKLIAFGIDGAKELDEAINVEEEEYSEEDIDIREMFKKFTSSNKLGECSEEESSEEEQNTNESTDNNSKEEIERLREELKSKERTIQELTRENEKIKKELLELARKEERINNEVVSKENLRAKVEAMSEKNKEQKKQIKKLTKENDKLAEENRELAGKNKEQKKQIKKLAKEKAELTKENDELFLQKQEYKDKTGELAKENKKLVKENEELKSKNKKYISLKTFFKEQVNSDSSDIEDESNERKQKKTVKARIKNAKQKSSDYEEESCSSDYEK